MILLHKIVEVKPQRCSLRHSSKSSQITVTQQRSQYRNNSQCILDGDEVKCLVRSVREWLEKCFMF